MRPALKILAVVLAVLVVVGLLVSAVGNVRAAAERMRCQNNLKLIGIALGSYHDSFGHYPTATVRGTDLPGEKRLSWFVELYPAFLEGGVQSHLDRNKAWDDPDNCPPRVSYPKDPNDPGGIHLAGREGRMALFQCFPVPHDRDQPCPTHYVGIAGLGRDAAELPLSDPRAGFFGHDREVTAEDVKGGTGSTLAVVETLDGGPWTAGGWPTVRGLVTDCTPYVGGLFSSRHHEGWWPCTHQKVTNALFADGSVRSLRASTSPQVIEALATIAAREGVAD